MSYELAFWRGETAVEARLAYERLVDGQQVEGVEPVDESAVVAACRDAFASWSVDANIWQVQPDSDGNGPGFDLALGSHLVTFTCYGLEGEQMNEIIDVMNRLRFPLYDPQTGERFGTPP